MTERLGVLALQPEQFGETAVGVCLADAVAEPGVELEGPAQVVVGVVETT